MLISDITGTQHTANALIGVVRDGRRNESAFPQINSRGSRVERGWKKNATNIKVLGLLCAACIRSGDPRRDSNYFPKFPDFELI